MAAPEYVPRKPNVVVRAYTSPPRRPASWLAVRPGEVTGEVQRTGGLYGSQGPDQGYALTLVRAFDDRLQLDDDEVILDDIDAGAVAIGLRRASRFGRAPVIHDLTVAYTIWGYLDPNASGELKALRKSLFAGVSHPHHYRELRRLADMVSDEVLLLPHAEVATRYAAGWRDLITVPADPDHG